MLQIVIDAPFQTSFKIITDCKELVNSLKLKYGEYSKSECVSADYIIYAKKRKEDYEIVFNSEVFITKYPLRKIIDIMYANRCYNEKIFAIHGAAVEFNGGGYLFVAATTSGKTTLTAYLVNKGFGYITDDCILLEKETFNIFPFTTPIHLRGGGFDILKSLGAEPKEYSFLDDISIKRYIYAPTNSINKPLPIKKIFFIERTECKNRIEKMSTNEKITALLKSPITEYKMNVDFLNFISKLSTLSCEKLYYSDMDFVAKVIKNGQ